MAAKDRYESLDEVGTLAVVLLSLDIALQALYALLSAARIAELSDLIAGRAVVSDELTPLELIQAIVGLGTSVIGIVLIFVIGRWIFRAAWNVRHLGAKRLDISPGWAVGWYFVPFANLVYPFRAMKEIWLASHDPRHWREGSVGLLTAWWTLWLATNIAANINLRLILSADTLSALRTVEWLSVVQASMGIPLSLVFLVVIRKVGAVQDRHATETIPPALPDAGTLAA